MALFLRMPDVYPVAARPLHCRDDIRETLDSWTSCSFFVEAFLTMLECHSSWSNVRTNVLEHTTQTLKRVLHMCYDLNTGKRIAGPTLRAAIDHMVFVDSHKKKDLAPPEDEHVPYSIYDHPEFDSDHAVACVLSLATTVGTILKMHYDIIPKMPQMQPMLRYDAGGCKYRNYMLPVAWCILSVAHITVSKSRNELIRTVDMAKQLCMNPFLFKAVERVEPRMIPYFRLFSSIVMRLMSAVCKMRNFGLLLSCLDRKDQWLPCGDAVVSASFPLFHVEYDMPISTNSIGICHCTTLMCQTFAHLWTFLTTQKAWTTVSNVGSITFLEPFDLPEWTLSARDIDDLRKDQLAQRKKHEEQHIEDLMKMF
jgi:hypothetical protein